MAWNISKNFAEYDAGKTIEIIIERRGNATVCLCRAVKQKLQDREAVRGSESGPNLFDYGKSDLKKYR